MLRGEYFYILSTHGQKLRKVTPPRSLCIKWRTNFIWSNFSFKIIIFCLKLYFCSSYPTYHIIINSVTIITIVTTVPWISLVTSGKCSISRPFTSLNLSCSTIFQFIWSSIFLVCLVLRMSLYLFFLQYFSISSYQNLSFSGLKFFRFDP